MTFIVLTGTLNINKLIKRSLLAQVLPCVIEKVKCYSISCWWLLIISRIFFIITEGVEVHPQADINSVLSEGNQVQLELTTGTKVLIVRYGQK